MQLSPDSRLPYSGCSVLESSKPGICCSQEGKESGICAVSEPHRHALLKYIKLNSSYKGKKENDPVAFSSQRHFMLQCGAAV